VIELSRRARRNHVRRLVAHVIVNHDPWTTTAITVRVPKR
jgi:hypothetical protein